MMMIYRSLALNGIPILEWVALSRGASIFELSLWYSGTHEYEFKKEILCKCAVLVSIKRDNHFHIKFKTVYAYACDASEKK